MPLNWAELGRPPRAFRSIGQNVPARQRALQRWAKPPVNRGSAWGGTKRPPLLYPPGVMSAQDALMQNLENIFQRIDNEFRDLKQAENSNVEEIRKILNRQAEASAYLVTRV